MMGPTVLVVEDELKLRELLRAYLEREGLMVYSTGSGVEAVGRGGGARAAGVLGGPHHHADSQER
jgi:CheY-like chemotaxis protein